MKRLSCILKFHVLCQARKKEYPHEAKYSFPLIIFSIFLTSAEFDYRPGLTELSIGEPFSIEDFLLAAQNDFEKKHQEAFNEQLKL
jgi:hypothetical protein